MLTPTNLSKSMTHRSCKGPTHDDSLPNDNPATEKRCDFYALATATGIHACTARIGHAAMEHLRMLVCYVVHDVVLW